MAYLLDTHIAIQARDGHDKVLDALAALPGPAAISALSLAELERGLYKTASYTAIRQERLAILLRHLPILPFDAAAAEAYGRIIALCGWVKGRDFDRMIAAQALITHAVLVTAAEGDFRDIPDLKIEPWSFAA